MRPAIARMAAWLAAALLMLLMLLAPYAPARADTALSLLQGFRGQVNVVGAEATLRTSSNSNSPCQLVATGSSVSATLSGIPSGATVLSAQLYWAGSGNTPDYTVSFNGTSVSAPSGRQYSSTTIGGGYNYFSGAVDVTSQVAARGNGTYTFGGLTVSNGNPWCASSAVVAGFALLVVYSAPSEPYRLLDVFEGFQYFRQNGLQFNFNGFTIPNPLPANATGRLAHITWEGDPDLGNDGEGLYFNNYELTDSLNPSGNPFNSASNIDGNASSYGIDFDAFTLKPPFIQAGQTSASAVYETGQDLVMLSAEVVAVPYAPSTDLSLSMARSGALTVGSSTDYVLTVSNGGADTEPGPVTVVDTLPSGLALVSTHGTGWSCSSVAGSGGSTVVTCSSSVSVASGSSMNPLTITVSPTRAGNYTNTATVSGQLTDSNTGNNSASDSSSASSSTPLSSTFVFTTRACNASEPIQGPGSSTGCPLYTGPYTAGDSASIYLTNVSGSGTSQVATALGSKDSTIPVLLQLACVPKGAVAASYAGVSLACGVSVPPVNMLFQANTPSAKLPSSTWVAAFSYLDVGQLTLSAQYGSAPATLKFVARPAAVVLKVRRSSDNVADQNDLSLPPDAAFAKAGEPFQLELAGVMLNSSNAPSFGLESTPASVTVTLASPANPINAWVGPTSFAHGTDPVTNDSVLVGTAQWWEAGLIQLTVQVVDYLGTGGYAPIARNIGRFYPDHFGTDMSQNFSCLAAMNCPVASSNPGAPAFGVSGASYSGQPVSVTVTAYGLHNTILSLYQNVSSRGVSLAAYSAPNGSAGPSGTFSVTTKVPASTSSPPYAAMQGTVTFQLPVPYNNGSPHANNWSAPQAVYLRATAADQRMAASGTQPFTITSQLASSTQSPPLSSQLAPVQSAPPPGQYEDGLMFVDGRVFVPNVFGSELARLPLPLAAQYWTGSTWQTNTNDNDSVVATSLALANCTRSFVGNCNASLLPIKSVSTAPTGGGAGMQLVNGSGQLSLQTPARGQNGTVDITVVNNTGANSTAASWLPSTVGRATFGLFNGRVIYLREVY